MTRILLNSTAFALTLLAAPALAQIPDTVAEIEVVQGWRGEDGIHRGALLIQLAPGWKTYWRSAGEGGIPPTFNWSGSDNLSALEMHFPVPEVFDTNDMRSYGYESRVVLPFQARPDANGAISLKGEIELGVCLDVCIPVTLDIADILPPTGSDRSDMIREAFADRPMTADEAGIRSIECRIEPISDGLRVTTEIDLGQAKADMAAVMELPDRSIWVSAASIQQDGRILTATTEMVPPTAQPFFLARDTLRVTLLGDGEAIEVLGCD